MIDSGIDLDLIAQTTIKFYAGFKVMPGGTLKAATSPDTDGDLVLDIVENRSCLNAAMPDTDGDKINDKWEIDNGFDPLSDDAGDDPDRSNSGLDIELRKIPIAGDPFFALIILRQIVNCPKPVQKLLGRFLQQRNLQERG